MADRLAHRRRLAALGQAFEHAIILPISYHAEKGSGAVVRTILAGTDALFWNWLSFLREQFVALVGIVVLVPTAIYMNCADGADPGGAGRRLCARQRVRGAARPAPARPPSSSYHNNVYGRVGDVLGNVTVVQSYARFAVRRCRPCAPSWAELLAAQYPGADLVGPAHRADAHRRHHHRGRHLSPLGAVLVGARRDHGRRDRRLRRLRRPADRQARPAVGLRRAHLPVRARHCAARSSTCSTPPTACARSPAPRRSRDVAGNVRYEDVTFRFRNSDQGVFDIELRGAGRQDHRAGRPDRRRQDHHARPAAAAARSRQSAASPIDGHDIADVTLNSLRHNIAVVFQDAGLFNRSIAENIRVGRPDATDAEVEEAARLAEAHDFIASKPGGYASSSASAAPRCRAASASASPSPAPS